jgi:hypothetical protein
LNFCFFPVEALVDVVLALGFSSGSLLCLFTFWVCFFRCEYLLFCCAKLEGKKGDNSSFFRFSLRMTCVNELANNNLGAAQLPGFSMVQL